MKLYHSKISMTQKVKRYFRA